jgi:mono/diheme cytochrome c family protein
MKAARTLGIAAAAIAVALAAGSLWADSRHSAGPYASISRGRYLVRAGDCKACHTADGGQPFAGGRAVPTPFGTIYSTNITPDNDTGIGRWDGDDFYRAMHNGIDRQGNHLYPAFPYPSYTKLSRDDVRAIKAYLDTVKPVRQRPTPNELPWPMSMRSMMAVWDGLYFDAGTYRSNPKQSAQWNRGAYLVQGLGHCGACHTHKNFAGATDDDHPLRGGYAEHVYAPSLIGNRRDGLGGWSADDIVEYLATGSNKESTAAGPMVEVVEQSTQYLSQPDLRAIAVYLKSLPGNKDDSRTDDRAGDDDTMKRGAQLYVDNCDGCHLRDGSGEPNVFPPLRASSAIQAAKPETLIQVVLQGYASPATGPKPTGLAMPAFSDKLSDADIADVLTYIRNSWGNHAGAVSSDDVGDLRKTLHQGP